MKTAKLLSLLAVLGSLGHAEAAWTRLPSTAPRPINLASETLPSTQIVSSENIGGSGVLLSEDPVQRATLSSGKAGVTVQMMNQQLIDSVVFVNFGAAGAVTLSGSTTLTGDWISLGQTTFSASDTNVSIQFAGAQVRYVRFSFDVSKAGSIACLSITGAATEPTVRTPGVTSGSGSDSSNKPNDSSAPVSVNLASAIGGAKPIYAYPTPTNIGEKDFAVNVIKFPRSSEKFQTIVYDLGTNRTVKEFSTAYTKRPTRLEVYAFKDLPEIQDWRGKLTLDPVIFSQNVPVAIGSDATGLGRIKLIPQKPVNARYIALRFEPNFQAASAETEGAWDSVSQVIDLVTGNEGMMVQSGGSGGQVNTVNIQGNIPRSEFNNVTNNIGNGGEGQGGSESNNGSSNNEGEPGDESGDPGEITGDQTPGTGPAGIISTPSRGSTGGGVGGGGGGGTTTGSTNNSGGDGSGGGDIIFNPPSGGGSNNGGGSNTPDDDEEPASQNP